MASASGDAHTKSLVTGGLVRSRPYGMNWMTTKTATSAPTTHRTMRRRERLRVLALSFTSASGVAALVPECSPGTHGPLPAGNAEGPRREDPAAAPSLFVRLLKPGRPVGVRYFTATVALMMCVAFSAARSHFTLYLALAAGTANAKPPFLSDMVHVLVALPFL